MGAFTPTLLGAPQTNLSVWLILTGRTTPIELRCAPNVTNSLPKISGLSCFPTEQFVAGENTFLSWSGRKGIGRAIKGSMRKIISTALTLINNWNE